MSFLDDLYRRHGNQVQDHVSSELGISRQKAAAVLPQVAPIVLAGLKRRMEQRGPEDVEQVAHEVAGSVGSDDIGALLRQGSQQAEIDPSLAGLLGDKGGEASQLMANQLGISPAAAAKLLPMLAPLIISMLLKRGKGTSGQGGGGGLAGILDRNGDGSILDDLAGLISGGGRGAGMSKGGCLSSLLGGLMKGRR